MDREFDPATAEFSVLLPVYGKDEPSHLDQAIRSSIDQTRSPSQIVVVADGPLTVSLRKTIESWADRHSNTIDVVQLRENHGLGTALNVGLRHCTNELVARIDADDVSRPCRFEKQLRFFDENPGAAVVGGYLGEFDRNREQLLHVREVPTEPSDIERFARFRNPMNHTTVMMKKSSVESVGSYETYPLLEDYHLWCRMLQQGYTLANIPEILVDARVGDEMFDRRGGVRYFLHEYRLQRTFLDTGFTTPLEFVRNLGMRVPVRLLPNNVRRFVYETFLREEPSGR